MFIDYTKYLNQKYLLTVELFRSECSFKDNVGGEKDVDLCFAGI